MKCSASDGDGVKRGGKHAEQGGTNDLLYEDAISILRAARPGPESTHEAVDDYDAALHAVNARVADLEAALQKIAEGRGYSTLYRQVARAVLASPEART